jgi:tetratricopeptide (TPR) repeat protein
LLIILVNPAMARQAKDELTPEVQNLYAQANAARQRGDSATAIERYRAIIQLAPHLAAAYNNLGMLYFNEHDYTHAVELLRRCLELDPGMMSASAVLGMSYFQPGQSAKAEPLLRAALGANPADDNVEMILSLVLIDLGKDREAAAQLRSFLDRNPTNQDAWYLLRKTYLRMSEEARSRIDDIDPDSAIAHEIAGEIDESAHNYAAALLEYRKAIDKAPHQPGTHMHMAVAYWHLGNWKSAQEEFRDELANDPNNCTARWQLADAMLEANGSSETALSELNQSIGLCPALMQAHVDRARALIRLGKHSDALPDLLMAEKESPTEPAIHYLLASVYRARGNIPEANWEMQTFGQLKSKGAAALP